MIQEALEHLRAGRYAQASRACEDLLRAAPDDAHALHLLGMVRYREGRPADAVALLRRAAAQAPADAEIANNLGNAYQALGAYDEAITAYTQALVARPDFSWASDNLGCALQRKGRLNEAVASHVRAIQIEPTLAVAYNNLGHALKDLGRIDEAEQSLRKSISLAQDLEVHSSLLYILNFQSRVTPAQMRAEAEAFGAAAQRAARPFTHWPNTRDPARRLNVGLVSGDLRDHPVGLFMEGVVACLDRQQVCLHVYQSGTLESELTERIRRHVPVWRQVVGLDDEALANLVRADGVDVLIDLAGHTAENRLPMLAWKPAPVQVTWLGYFATTGVPGIDYLLADPCSVPPGHESHFTETIWRLPETRYCFTPPAPCPGINALPAGDAGHLTFGSFGNTAKLNDDVVATWSTVLRSLPGARLLLKSRQLAEGANADHITARFARHGVPAGSLILEGQSPRAGYLEAYQRVDIVLDTFPYPGGTTTLEALWMGVPVLTMRGDRLLARQGECLMRGAGLEAFVAQDANDFVARAVALAGQRRALADIRASLRERLFYSPLFDARRFSVHLEAALRGMWSRWCARSA